MKREISTYGHIKDGKLNISYRSKFIEALSLFSDCRIELTVKKLYKKRSNMQNAYYHCVIVGFFRDGWEATQGEMISHAKAHEILKFNCNYSEIINKKTGEILRHSKTTTKLTTVEMEEYNENCRKFIFEWFGITVPLPCEQSEISYNFD